MDLHGFPTTLPEFQRVLPDEAACAKYLEPLRWPNGFTCTKCGSSGEPYRFAQRTSVVLRCRACQANVSLMADTGMKDSHTPLSIGFWGAYLVATQTPGQSALQFQRQLGLSRHETAFQMFHKLRAGMVRPERDAIGSRHPVEVDETFVGGRGAKELTQFVQDNVAQGAVVRTDGWRGYDDLAKLGYTHELLVLDGDPERIDTPLPMIHIAFSNLKTWLPGTHHGVSQQH